MRVLRRLVVMALVGFVGAALGGVAGEALFRYLPQAQPAAARDTGPREICLVFDTSESMRKRTARGETQLEALRSAALEFLAKPEFAGDELALVAFDDEARLLAPRGGAPAVREALSELRANGRTDIASALDTARGALAGGERSWIVLFTDGKPQTARVADPVEETRQAARACREAGIGIVAVATGLAERSLLEEVTGDPANVFLSAPEALNDAFERSGELIQNREMLASAPAPADLEGSVVRASGWAALVALGTALALVRGHDRHLRRRGSLGFGRATLLVLGAAASGLVAGVAGQGTFYVLSPLAALEPVLRSAAWVLLGSALVLGMSFVVPNLPRVRALVGGALGGGAAVACFLRIVPEVGDTAGRLLGAALLGLFAGAMTVLVEATVRRAWLVVRWPGGERSTLLLGATPVVVGHSARAHICPVFDEEKEPVIGSFTFDAGVIRYEDRRSGKHRNLRGGDELAFDPIVVEVHAERAREERARLRAAGASERSEGRSSSGEPRPSGDGRNEDESYRGRIRGDTRSNAPASIATLRNRAAPSRSSAGRSDG